MMYDVIKKIQNSSNRFLSLNMHDVWKTWSLFAIRQFKHDFAADHKAIGSVSESGLLNETMN